MKIYYKPLNPVVYFFVIYVTVSDELNCNLDARNCILHIHVQLYVPIDFIHDNCFSIISQFLSNLISIENHLR